MTKKIHHDQEQVYGKPVSSKTVIVMSICSRIENRLYHIESEFRGTEDVSTLCYEARQLL